MVDVRGALSVRVGFLEEPHLQPCSVFLRLHCTETHSRHGFSWCSTSGIIAPSGHIGNGMISCHLQRFTPAV